MRAAGASLVQQFRIDDGLADYLLRVGAVDAPLFTRLDQGLAIFFIEYAVPEKTAGKGFIAFPATFNFAGETRGDDAGYEVADAASVEEAEQTLALTNSLNEFELDQGLRLHRTAAESIVLAQPIATIDQLSRLYYVGGSALSKLKYYAALNDKVVQD